MHFGGVGVLTKCRFFAVLSTRFVDVVQQVIEDAKNLEVFAMFVWTLWYHRNGAVFKETAEARIGVVIRNC